MPGNPVPVNSAPPLHQNGWFIGFLLFFCAPIGVVLALINPRWSAKVKLAVVGGYLVLLFVGIANIGANSPEGKAAMVKSARDQAAGNAAQEKQDAAQAKVDGEAAATANKAARDADSRASAQAASEAAAALQARTITAPALYAAYAANEVAADEKYKDKSLIITGTVESIGKDGLDTMYVSLAGDGFLSSVQCMFDTEHKGELSRLSKGQHVVIEGRCTGSELGLKVVIADSSLR